MGARLSRRITKKEKKEEREEESDEKDKKVEKDKKMKIDKKDNKRQEGQQKQEGRERREGRERPGGQGDEGSKVKDNEDNDGVPKDAAKLQLAIAEEKKKLVEPHTLWQSCPAYERVWREDAGAGNSDSVS